jgi:signal transduction histidine kinase
MLLEYQKNFFNHNFAKNRRANRMLRSGKSVTLDLSNSIIQFENGKSLLLGIFRDISIQIKAEEDLRNSEKLAAIGKMTAFLSHEIKTPLVSINMNIDMLSKSLDLPESKKKSFSIIQKEVKRLDKLLRNVLQYSRQVELINSNVNLANLINNIRDFLEPILAERKIEFKTDLNDCIIMGDYQKLQSAFLHLIENAIESINENGKIIITITLDEQTEKASITIMDDGPGFDESINIFEPFFTTKSSGTGVGLPISQKIIEQHHGKLKLLSSKPGSTIFEITFNLEN